jgi:hypothetical protein
MENYQWRTRGKTLGYQPLQVKELATERGGRGLR